MTTPDFRVAKLCSDGTLYIVAILSDSALPTTIPTTQRRFSGKTSRNQVIGPQQMISVFTIKVKRHHDVPLKPRSFREPAYRVTPDFRACQQA